MSFPIGFSVFARCGVTRMRLHEPSLEAAYSLISRLSAEGYECAAPQPVYGPDNVVELRAWARETEGGAA